MKSGRIWPSLCTHGQTMGHSLHLSPFPCRALRTWTRWVTQGLGGTDVHSHSKAYCDMHSESTNFSKYFTLSWFQVHCSSCRKGLWPCPMSELPSGKSRLCRMHIKPWVSCPSLRAGPELRGGLESLSFQNKEIEIQTAAQLAANCGGDSLWIFAPSTLLAVESKSCPTERF